MATIETKLRPFLLPKHAVVEEAPGLRQDGFQEAKTIPLSELPASTLQEMASDWLRGLYDKAGKSYNWRFD